MNKNDTLSKLLKISAMQKGLCDEWTKEWKDGTDPLELIEKYKRGIDFCIINKWPDKEFISKNFDGAFLKSCHIYHADNDIDDGNFSDAAAIVQHGSKGELHFCNYNAATVWVLYDSEIVITASGSARIFVHVYDTSKATIIQSGDARVTVKCHTKEAEAIRVGDVKYIGHN